LVPSPPGLRGLREKNSRKQNCGAHTIPVEERSIYHVIYSLFRDQEFWGTYHLHGKTGNSSWKIKWFVPFRLGSFGKYGL